MPSDLIPALDPAPLPGPPWLFHLLWVLTFFIHLLFVNGVLGGTLLAALTPRDRPGGARTQRFFVELNGWAISLAITFGIAPLLFLQVLLGRFFYSATVLVAWAWLGMLGLLTLAYYLNYLAKHRLRKGEAATGILWTEALLFLGVAAVHVTVNLAHLQPARWAGLAAQPWSALLDPTFLPRYLHFVLAALGFSGALLAFAALRVTGEEEDRRATARLGLRAALLATALQVLDGFWLLLALPAPVLKGFMRGGALTMVPLTLGILLALGLLALLARNFDPLAQPVRVRRVLELTVAAMVPMVLTRHQLRDVYLAVPRAGEQAVVAPQWGPFFLFFGVFILCVGLTVWAVVLAVKDRPGPGEPVA
ncbi:MAG: hypothetical protein HY823_01325 [Acidobacteria bacterium]|nr:hypothetical protein [Acidobacteriota bacterium]